MISLIRNREIELWKNSGKWVFVYGRRKTGKSFFVRNFLKWDKYYFIGRSGEIFDNDDKISYEIFAREIFSFLKNNKVVVIDEIQRLPEEFHDMLHNFGVKGKLIVLSSTIFVAKNLLANKSPLLGLFSEFKMGLISEKDIIKNLLKCKKGKDLIEHSVYLREPWLFPLWEESKDFLFSMSYNTKITVPALVGEIFLEESRNLTAVYEGVLKAVADGKRTSGDITNYLYALKIINAQNSSLVHPYLNVLCGMHILNKVKVFNKNKYFYYHNSPVLDLFYYLDEKYGFSQRDLQEEQVLKVIKQKLPLHVEQFFRNFLSDYFGLNNEIISDKDREIDIVLTDFRKIKVVGEVKWKKDIKKDEIKKIQDKFVKFDCKKLLIVPDKKKIGKIEGIVVYDVSDIVKMV